MLLLKTEKLSKTYKSGDVTVRALDDVNLMVKEGEILCIWGRSASGKTTLLNLIGCLDEPTSGRIFLEGLELTSLSPSELPVIRREKFGFIFQQFNLISHLSALENVALPLKYSGIGIEERNNRALEALKYFGLEKRRDFLPHQLSGGELQRVAIARALINTPRIILADEPTGELDTFNAGEFASLVKLTNREMGQTFLIVTHDEILRNIAHRVLIIEDGKIGRNQSSQGE